MDLTPFELVPWESTLVAPGDTYGRFTVLAIGKKPGTYKYYAICQCECGSPPKAVRIDHLRRKKTESCGCFWRERMVKHDNWNHPLYHRWQHMLNRCYNPKDTRYDLYHGRGITVCERWHDLNNFIEDMYPTFKPHLEIDRIDNDKGYYPENCHWVTRKEQQRNKTSNVKLTHDGQTLVLSEWAEKTGICYGTLWSRVQIRGWSAKQVLTTPPMDAHERLKIARNARKR